MEYWVSSSRVEGEELEFRTGLLQGQVPCDYLVLDMHWRYRISLSYDALDIFFLLSVAGIK